MLNYAQLCFIPVKCQHCAQKFALHPPNTCEFVKNGTVTYTKFVDVPRRSGTVGREAPGRRLGLSTYNKFVQEMLLTYQFPGDMGQKQKMREVSKL